MPHVMIDTFVAPEERLTAKMKKRLKQLAPLFHIHLEPRTVDGETHVEFSGDGFSGEEPLVLDVGDADVRLLAEICSILARWVPFSVWEPCEATLFALPEERVERHAASLRKQLAKAQREAAREAEREVARSAVAVLDVK